MHKIIAGLYIGDYRASQQFPVLRELGIVNIIAAMTQTYEAPKGFKLHRLLVEDTDKTNLLAHFEECNDIIRTALVAGEKVLVHCQAGVSRSTTICAAFLMSEFGLTADEAVERISAVRSIVEPTDFFLAQLEMYERMGYEVDPAKSAEYRRFLFNFNHNEMMDGDGQLNQLFLAYYPSPAPTPRERSTSDPFRSLRMTPVDTPLSSSRRGSNASLTSMSRKNSTSSARKPSFGMTSITSLTATEDEALGQPRGRKSRMNSELGMTSMGPMTALSPGSPKTPAEPLTPGVSNAALRENIRHMLHKHAEDAQPPNPVEAEEAKKAKDLEYRKQETRAVIDGRKGLLAVGQGRVVVTGRRLRCKMCRRELAARQHIVEHEVGEGQAAFAPRRRDMAQHRRDVQKKKKDGQDASGEASSSALSAKTQDELPALVAAQSLSEPPQPVAKPSSRIQLINKPGPFSKPIFVRRGTEEVKLDLDNGLFTKRLDQSDCAIEDDDSPGPTAPSPPLLCSSMCSSYFTEPLSWMSDQLADGQLAGKILCPNARCGSKLGSFDWAGLQCSCGAWVVPAFMLNASKVDEVSI